MFLTLSSRLFPSARYTPNDLSRWLTTMDSQLQLNNMFIVFTLVWLHDYSSLVFNPFKSIILIQEKQTTRPWLSTTVKCHQSKMAAPAKFKAENGSYSHVILKIIKNTLECFLRIFNLRIPTNIFKIICLNNRGSL